MELTEKQLEAFRKLWFVYGNHGKKCTPGNHSLVQGFYQYHEDRRDFYLEGKKNMAERFGQEYADKNGITDECLNAVNEVLANP